MKVENVITLKYCGIIFTRNGQCSWVANILLGRVDVMSLVATSDNF